MLGPPKPRCLDQPIAVSLEELVPADNVHRHLEKVRGYHTTAAYKKAIRKRQVWVEPLFAEAKEWHGLRRLRLAGLMNANIQGLLIATGQNPKRLLAATGWGHRQAPCGSLVALPQELGELSAAYGRRAIRPESEAPVGRSRSSL